MTEPKLRIDIVSDVVCPWCAVGYYQLARALEQTAAPAEIFWHPFELNPRMAPEGEDLRAHLAGKYGASPAESAAARDRLAALGDELGFRFAFTNTSRIVNTFQAHQLIDWAGTQGRAHDMKLALFAAYFTDAKDVSDPVVLADLAGSIGLDATAARAALDTGAYAEKTRAKEHFWTSRGVQGVPAMIFDAKHLVSGAQGVAGYARIVGQLAPGLIRA